MFEETLRIDYSNHILGLRLNFFVASLLFVAGIAWFLRTQGLQPRRADPGAQAACHALDLGSRERR